MSNSKSEKEKLVDRLHRISGQVQGIERMIRKNKSCLAIIQQVIATRNALGKVATKILTQESCKRETRQSSQEFEKIISSLVELK